MSVLDYELFYENITYGLFCIFVFFGDRLPALSLSVGFFRTSGLHSVLVDFFSWPRWTTQHKSYLFSNSKNTYFSEGGGGGECVYGSVRMEGKIQRQKHGFPENFAPKNIGILHISYPKIWVKIVF